MVQSKSVVEWNLWFPGSKIYRRVVRATTSISGAQSGASSTSPPLFKHVSLRNRGSSYHTIRSTTTAANAERGDIENGNAANEAGLSGAEPGAERSYDGGGASHRVVLLKR